MKKSQSAVLLIKLMKLSFAQILFAALFTSVLYANNTRGQVYLDKPISISANEIEIKKIINEIEKQTNVLFVYSPKAIQANRRISCNISNKKLGDFLNDVFKSLNIGFSTAQNGNEQIVLYSITKPSATSVSPQPTAKDANLSITKEEATTYFSITITGKVVNDKGLPVAGASVTEKGTTNVAIADDNGNFKISVKDEKSILVISDVGSISREITVGSQKFFAINLKDSSKDLDEVLIVGYGKQKKVTSTGAQASITGATLVASPAANISNSLVGRLPGLFATQASGEPGNDASRILIRGVGTFSGSQGPLILVDGIQVDNYNNIDPNEIESVTILKDASSTAVYGIRGANGVLLITTKRGKTGTPVVNYSFNNAMNSFTSLRGNMNSYDFANALNEALKNDAYVSNSAYTPRYTDAAIAKYKSGEDPIFFPNTNWYDLLIKKFTLQQQHNLSIRGGTDKVKYFVSAGMFNQEGLFNNTKIETGGFDAQLRYKRYNFRSNLNFDINKRFKAALDISAQIENRNGANTSTTSIINNILGANPTLHPGLIDGKIVSLFPFTPDSDGGIGSNPLTLLYSGGNKFDYRSFLNGSLRLDHDLDFVTKGLTTHFIVGYQNNNRQLDVYRRPFVSYQARRLADNSIAYSQLLDFQNFALSTSFPERSRRTTLEFALDYKRNFNGHNVTGLLLYNQIKTFNPSFAYVIPNGYQSYVARGVYDYKGRYLAEISAAYNGTENFAPDRRFGLFPAFSVGWVPSAETFFPKNDMISFLKIRASYGEVGNDQLSSDYLFDANNRFLYRPTTFANGGSYYFGTVGNNYQSYPGIREGRANNPLLTWERAIKTNLGIEATLFNSKMTATVEVFNEERDNILWTPGTVSALTGNTLAAQNLGKMSNAGYEVDLGFKDNINNFNYWVKANYSFAKNKVLFQDEVTRAFPYQQRTGNTAGQPFGLVADGFYNTWEEVNSHNRPITTFMGNNRLQPGDIKYKDINGDGRIDNDDMVPIGYSSIPQVTYGISFGGQWNGFDFSVLFQGASRVSISYSRRANQAFFDVDPAAAVEYLSESWTKERYEAGLPINFPRFGVGNGAVGFHNYQSSTFFTRDASYIRLKNVEIGYSLDKKLLSKIRIKSCRFYLNANNLATFSSVYRGIDPETPNLGANNEPYPLTRTINAGFNVSF